MSIPPLIPPPPSFSNTQFSTSQPSSSTNSSLPQPHPPHEHVHTPPTYNYDNSLAAHAWEVQLSVMKTYAHMLSNGDPDFFVDTMNTFLDLNGIPRVPKVPPPTTASNKKHRSNTPSTPQQHPQSKSHTSQGTNTIPKTYASACTSPSLPVETVLDILPPLSQNPEPSQDTLPNLHLSPASSCNSVNTIHSEESIEVSDTSNTVEDPHSLPSTDSHTTSTQVKETEHTNTLAQDDEDSQQLQIHELSITPSPPLFATQDNSPPLSSDQRSVSLSDFRLSNPHIPIHPLSRPNYKHSSSSVSSSHQTLPSTPRSSKSSLQRSPYPLRHGQGPTPSQFNQ